MIQRMVASALFAGFAAGLIAALLHFAFVQKLILLGEEYETGALVHFQAAAGVEAPASHDTGEATADSTDHTDAEGAPALDHETAEPPSDLKRNTLTVLFTVLTYTAYALLLVAGFALAEQFGRRIDGRDGILWGIAGFVAFQFAPAMGLAPELPGTIAAELPARQIWWLGTALATGAGLALLGYGNSWMAAMVAGALLAAPHVIGAPESDQFWGVAPPEVGAAFAARVLGVGMVVWAALGWIAARLWNGKTA